jgi:hypothetical protein
MGRLLEKCQVSIGDKVGEVGIVDVRVDGLEGNVRAQGGPQRLEERLVGIRIPEIAALHVCEREAPCRDDDTDRSPGLVQALGDKLPGRAPASTGARLTPCAYIPRFASGGLDASL